MNQDQEHQKYQTTQILKHTYIIHFTLSGAEIYHQCQLLKTPENNQHILYPITTAHELRYRIQKQIQQPYYTNLMKDEEHLQKKLSDASKKTQKLKQVLFQMEQQATSQHRYKPHKKHRRRTPRKKKKRRHSSTSSSSSTESSDSSNSE